MRYLTVILLAVLVAAIVSLPAFGQSVNIPLAQVDETLPLVGGASLKMGASFLTPGGSKLVSKMTEAEKSQRYECHVAKGEAEVLWDVLNLGGTKIVANFDSLRAGEVEVAPNGCMEYPFQVCFNTPFTGRRLGFALANPTKDIDTIRPLTLVNGGWFSMLPIGEMAHGMPYQVLLYGEFEGRKDWTYLGVIHTASKTGKKFSSAVTVTVTQPIEELEEISPDEAALYFSDLMGWRTAIKPNAKKYVAFRKAQALSQASANGQLVEEKTSQPAVEPEKVEQPQVKESPKLEENPPVKVELPEDEEIPMPDVQVKGLEFSEDVELWTVEEVYTDSRGQKFVAKWGEPISTDEISQTGMHQYLPGPGWYCLRIGGAPNKWETTLGSKPLFWFDGKPVTIFLKRS